jgi:dnd system-associated protein 4
MSKRINYIKCNESILNELVSSSNTSGPFENKAKCLIYAASLAASFGPVKGRKTLSGTKMDLRYDAFSSRDFEDFICSLAVFATKDIKILENNEDTANERVKIFEEFANCGLERLEAELKGEANKTDGIALLLSKNFSGRVDEDGINWGKIESL